MALPPAYSSHGAPLGGIPADLSHAQQGILLTTVEGLSQDEAAAVLKTTRKAIEMRLYRARRKLAEDLGEA